MSKAVAKSTPSPRFLAAVDRLRPRIDECEIRQLLKVGRFDDVVRLTADAARRSSADLPNIDGRGQPCIDPSKMPSTYAMRGEGDCMVPVIANDTRLIFSATEVPAQGNFVAIYLRPEAVPVGCHQIQVKRFVAKYHLGFVVETLKPRRTLKFRNSDVLAVHKCLGVDLYDGRRELISRSEIAIDAREVCHA